MPALVLLLAYLGFVSLGLPDATLGVVWPSLRSTFGLPQAALGLALVAVSAGYSLSSLNAGVIIRRLGVGSLLAASTLIMALAMAGYSLSVSWPMYLACAFCAGIGSGAIDTGLNTYAANHFSSKHMSWLHACYGVGATLGPVVMTAVLSAGLIWRWGFGLLALGMVALGTAFTFTRRLWDGSPALAAQPARRGDRRRLLSRFAPWLQILLFFVYTGLEVTAGEWSFTLLTESRGVGLTTAGLWVSAYWGSLTVGRFVLGNIVERVGLERLIGLSLAGAVAGAALIALPWWPALNGFGLALLGFALAPIFPCLMSLTPLRFGAANSVHLVGFQTTAAILGAFSLPSLAGLLAQSFNLEAVAAQLVIVALLLTALHITLRALLRRPKLNPQMSQMNTD
jgi:fucose permease